MGLSLKKPLGNVGKNFSNFLFGRNEEGMPGAPDLGFLRDTGKFDFLRDTGEYDFLRDEAVGNRYLRSPEELTAGAARVGGRGEDYFADLIGNINAPSSVDEVQRGIESDYLDQILGGIDEDTAR